MPKATVSHETFRHELKSCPGGYVELRQLSYYEMMQRRDIAAKLWTEMDTGRANKKGKRDVEMMRSQLEILNVQMMEFDFRNCIADHNLEDDQGVILDFGNPMSLRVLDPRIGAEIDRRIEELNQEDEEDLSPLENAVTSSSLVGETKLSLITPED